MPIITTGRLSSGVDLCLTFFHADQGEVYWEADFRIGQFHQVIVSGEPSAADLIRSVDKEMGFADIQEEPLISAQDRTMFQILCKNAEAELVKAGVVYHL